MCWAKKCCGFFRLDIGCVLIGILSLILTTTLSVAFIVILGINSHEDELHIAGPMHRLSAMLNIEYIKSLVQIVTAVLAILAIAGVYASLVLIRGIQKNKPGYLICYFSYGIVVIIMVNLTALLLILHKKWEASIGLFLAGLFYIHFLVVVHTAYETMQRGKSFGSNPHDVLDDECFIISDDET